MRHQRSAVDRDARLGGIVEHDVIVARPAPRTRFAAAAPRHARRASPPDPAGTPTRRRHATPTRRAATQAVASRRGRCSAAAQSAQIEDLRRASRPAARRAPARRRRSPRARRAPRAAPARRAPATADRRRARARRPQPPTIRLRVDHADLVVEREHAAGGHRRQQRSPVVRGARAARTAPPHSRRSPVRARRVRRRCSRARTAPPDRAATARNRLSNRRSASSCRRVDQRLPPRQRRAASASLPAVARGGAAGPRARRTERRAPGRTPEPVGIHEPGSLPRSRPAAYSAQRRPPAGTHGSARSRRGRCARA